MIRNNQQENNLVNFFNRTEGNINIKQTPNGQSLTLENMEGNGISDHNSEIPKVLKSYVIQNIKIKNESARKGQTNCTNKTYYFLSEENTRTQTKEETLLGKKRLEPNTPDYESLLKEIGQNALINIVQLLNDISSKVYAYKSDFIINKDLINVGDFIETNLEESIKEILLMMGEEKELIQSKIKALIELESKQKNNVLPFYKETFKMKLKDLVSFYINDKIYRFYQYRLITLKDSLEYNDEEKIEIRKQIPKYFKYQKEQTSNIIYNEVTFNQPLSYLNQLSNDIIIGENHIEEKLISNMQIESNQERDNERHKEPDNKQLIKEKKGPKKADQKLGDEENKENNEQEGKRNENLVRISIKECLLFLIDMINSIANVELSKVPSYDSISGNSSKKFNQFFSKTVGDFIKVKYEKFVESILNSKDTSREIQFLKDLFKKELFIIVNYFANDITYSFKSSNGLVVFKTLKDIDDQRIQDDIKNNGKIKKKINELLGRDKRIREPSTKKKMIDKSFIKNEVKK